MRRSFSHRRGQQMVEVILLVGLVCLALAWITDRTQEAVKKSYQDQRRVLAAPL